jgi:putrescine transport system substrate-binding protein
MIKKIQKALFCGLLASLFTFNAQADDKVVHIYNWSDYIPPDLIANFEKETGIKVIYDVFDSNEVLEAKLFAGHTGYDIVVPSAAPFFARQILAGVYQPLNKAKLTNYKNLNPKLLAKIATVDPQNQYGIPYLWGTTGIGYNVEKVKAALGPNVKLDGWDVFFKPENLAKLKGCGVSVLDAPNEILSIALRYLGKDPNSIEPNDYQVDAQKLLLSIRPYITYFHSSQYINDLANGDICIAIGWSGDVFQAAKRAKESGKGINVSYFIPKEGTVIFFDMMAIPKDAKNVDNALTFLNYMMRPEVAASATNYLSYANANQASNPLILPKIFNNPNIYPSAEVQDKLYVMRVMPPNIDRIMTRTWIKIKTGV